MSGLTQERSSFEKRWEDIITKRSILWIAILALILTGCFSKVERLQALGRLTRHFQCYR